MKPSGLEILQAIVDSAKVYEKAYRISDFAALKSLYLISAKQSIELLPHITDKEFTNVMYDIGNECLSSPKILANGGGLSELANLEKQMMSSLFKATE